MSIWRIPACAPIRSDSVSLRYRSACASARCILLWSMLPPAACPAGSACAASDNLCVCVRPIAAGSCSGQRLQSSAPFFPDRFPMPLPASCLSLCADIAHDRLCPIPRPIPASSVPCRKPHTSGCFRRYIFLSPGWSLPSSRVAAAAARIAPGICSCIPCIPRGSRPGCMPYRSRSDPDDSAVGHMCS